MSTPTADNQGWIPTGAHFGARLALVRQHVGWGNVTEAALACGLPVASWRNWERDGRLPRDLITVCRKIADRTGCDLGWLAGLPQKDSNLQPADEQHSDDLPAILPVGVALGLLAAVAA